MNDDRTLNGRLSKTKFKPLDGHNPSYHEKCQASIHNMPCDFC